MGRCAVALCVARAAFDALACLLEPAAALRVALDRLAALLREEELDDVRELRAMPLPQSVSRRNYSFESSEKSKETSSGAASPKSTDESSKVPASSESDEKSDSSSVNSSSVNSSSVELSSLEESSEASSSLEESSEFSSVFDAAVETPEDDELPPELALATVGEESDSPSALAESELDWLSLLLLKDPNEESSALSVAAALSS